MALPTLPGASPHNNQQLFSDYYLDAVLPGLAGWDALAAEASRVRDALAAKFAAYTPSANEAQTEDEWVKPVLTALGHTFEIQAALKTPDGTKKPDYVFYANGAARDAQKNKTLTDALPSSGGLAVGDAKYWERPLDFSISAKGGDPFSNKNPAYQIAFYMQHSGVAWGILTNGRLWRLYHKDTAHKLDRFYEVDLPALIQAENARDFLYFFAFFRRAAFDAGPLGLETLRAASLELARGVGETLKRQVYDALRHLAQGFLDYSPNALPSDAETLKAIYDNSLIVLYRLLFVLYAESRGLLPIHVPAYRDNYSLHSLKREVADRLDSQKPLLATSAKLWPQLTELFSIIDAGSSPLHVTTYNGGLFDPARRDGFLTKHKVGDAHLQRAIDMLCRIDGAFVDYRDLSERHLGTIYEGLLEYHLEMLATPEDEWTVALLNDRGERKETGSYYTPDFIVKFLVERTVGPMLDAAVADKDDNEAKIAAVLAVNVLDPAMGSGHFLVEAVEFIARFLIDLTARPADDEPDAPDIAYWKRRVVQSCIYGVDLNPLAVDLAKLSLWLSTLAADRPLSFLDHHLRCGNALVGARLETLRVGPSPKKSSRKSPDKTHPALFDADDLRQSMTVAVEKMAAIEASPAATVADVKAQERAYEEVRAALGRQFGHLAALVTSSYFGVAIDAAFWGPLAAFARGDETVRMAKFQTWLDEAARENARVGFFHYELEFPEVFFDSNGRGLGEAAGFDAVVGNPPYVRQEKLAPLKPYLKASFSAFHAAADLYLFFFEQGVNVLQTGGRLGFVSSGTFARANFAASFRRWLPTVAQMETLIDFGENQPFVGAEMVRPTITVLRKEPGGDAPFRSLFLSEKVPPSLSDALDSDGFDCAAAVLHQSEWTFQSADMSALAAKIFAVGTPLSEVVDGQIFYGIKTGFNEAFIIDAATKARLIEIDAASAEIIKPLVQGEDLRPWYQEDEGRWLIFTRRGININGYPAVKEYLEQFRSQLQPRPANFEASQKWPGRKAGTYKWYELQDSIDYYQEFDKPKIFWPDIAKLPRFSWDETGKYVNDKGFIITGGDPALLAILQSRVTWFAISQICVPLRLRAGLWQFQTKSQFVNRLPIPNLTDADRAALSALAVQLTADARARYALHVAVRRRIQADLGTPDSPLNLKLSAWWRLTFGELRAQVKHVYGKDIPLGERDEWEAWLTAQKETHDARTAAIIAGETDLNARVGELFGLTNDERKLIESSTKYAFGEV